MMPNEEASTITAGGIISRCAGVRGILSCRWERDEMSHDLRQGWPVRYVALDNGLMVGVGPGRFSETAVTALDELSEEPAQLMGNVAATAEHRSGRPA